MGLYSSSTDALGILSDKLQTARHKSKIEATRSTLNAQYELERELEESVVRHEEKMFDLAKRKIDLKQGRTRLAKQFMDAEMEHILLEETAHKRQIETAVKIVKIRKETTELKQDNDVQKILSEMNNAQRLLS